MTNKSKIDNKLNRLNMPQANKPVPSKDQRTANDRTEKGPAEGILGLSAYTFIFNFVIIPLVILFALSSAIPRWLSKKEKWHRDFQYLIHGVFLLKLTLLTTNLAHTIVNIE